MIRNSSGLPLGQTSVRWPFALAGVQRHERPVDLMPDLARYRSKGYTGIWLENDYLEAGSPGNSFFGNNWRLFNLFDFTLGRQKACYTEYLEEMCALCREEGLDVFMSFWLPMLNGEFLAWLQQYRPDALGSSESFHEKATPCLCSCEAGGGLGVLSEMVGNFVREFPEVRGIKVSTEDNDALLCDAHCPNALGTTRARHAGNMFSTVWQAARQARADVSLVLYPWFWREGYEGEVLPRLEGDYFILTKMEAGSVQHFDSEAAPEPLFDSSIVSDKPGPKFQRWVETVGPDRIIDMVPVSSGIDDFFLAAPPYPGRLFRRLRHLADAGVRRFLDFECGGHHPGSSEETVALFPDAGCLDEAAFLELLSRRLYRAPAAQVQAIAGWRAFDRGFGFLPIGLGETGTAIYSGRFGFAWSLCLATPLLANLIGRDRRHQIHWFSPYNFFGPHLAGRLTPHFIKVQTAWQEAARHLAVAHALDGAGNDIAFREAIAAEAHALAATSALNWCAAGRAVEPDAWTFGGLMHSELAVVRQFADLVQRHPWVWANNCWHPHRTPLSQRGIHKDLAEYNDVFAAKTDIMKEAIESRERSAKHSLAGEVMAAGGAGF